MKTEYHLILICSAFTAVFAPDYKYPEDKDVAFQDVDANIIRSISDRKIRMIV